MKKLALLFLLPLASACYYHDLADPVDCSREGVNAALLTVLPATDCSTTDGSIDISVEGGKPPYSYYLNDVAMPSRTFTQLAAGIYSVRVVDASRCDTTVSNILVGAQDFSFSTVLTEDNLCVGNNGTVQIAVSDGSPPYQFKIDGGNFSDTNLFTGLSPGAHVVEVRDNNDCTISLNLTVPRGNTGTSWAGDIRPIMVASCSDIGCHDGASRVDLRVYSNAKQYAADIKSLTQERRMPYEGTIPQNQIDLIACWVDDGAPNN